MLQTICLYYEDSGTLKQVVQNKVNSDEVPHYIISNGQNGIPLNASVSYGVEYTYYGNGNTKTEFNNEDGSIDNVNEFE